MHYVDIDTQEPRDTDASKLILNARKGLRKAQTKNLQGDTANDPNQPVKVEEKVGGFDMDRLLSKNNIWLKDHGTYRGNLI